MVWPAARQPTDALTGEFVPEIWSARVLNHVKSNLVCMNVVNTSFEAELSKGDKVYIPVLSALTASLVDPVITDTSAYTNMNATIGTTAVSISIDKWYEVPVAIDDSVKSQTQISGLLDKLALNQSYAVEKVIDTDVNGLFSTLNSSTVYGADGQTFTDTILTALMETLDEADVPRTDRALICDPSTIADIYKIDKFMSMDYGQTTFTTDGYRGRINQYNLPVFCTNNLTAATTGAYGCLLHKDAIGLVIQDGPTIEKWRAHEKHADVVNCTALWGADEIRDTFGIPFYTRKK